MATIITKNSSTASSVPLAANMTQGELAVNVTDKRIFTENASGVIVELGTTPSSLAATGAVTGSNLSGTNTGDLVSGTTIKTINSTSLLGSGDISIAGITPQTVGFTATGGTTPRTFTGDVNLTASAVATLTGANTFTDAQEWATGTAVASASTINLNTATGNRVHITGTTTITAVTLTRGPRTVIFDGILTLTHNATTNNLPGAANITTAAGDRAIYESDGTTVYCVSYIKVSGVAVVSSVVGTGDHTVVVTTGNGLGSTNTAIRRFTTTLVSVGTAITYADSATLGATFTINETGLYSMTYVDDSSAELITIGISVNSTQLTTNIHDITAANRLVSVHVPTATPTGVSVARYLTATDVIRAVAASANDVTARVRFSITKISA